MAACRIGDGLGAYELTDTKLTMVLDGEEFDLPSTPGSLPAGLLDERQTVVCTDATMTISQGGLESTLERVG